jgi:small subunit ribosomal protein S4
MSRYRGPRLRIVRRIGVLPGLTTKVSRKNSYPGQNGSSANRKVSLYNVRLREKQKLRFNYGINERQLLNYVKLARRKKGSAGRILLSLLEMRLDNIVFRLGFASTIYSARQLVNHGHILVDSVLVNIPSFICRPKNIISVKRSSKSLSLIKSNLEASNNLIIPQHLSLNLSEMEAKIVGFVNRKSISILVNELLIIEYYSRKL